MFAEDGSDPRDAATFPFVVKAWCGLPGGVRKSKLHEKLKETCEDDLTKCKPKGGLFGYGACNFEYLNSIQKLVDAAGLAPITPRTWTATIKSALPQGANGEGAEGRTFESRVQQYVRAPGVSIETVTAGTLTPDNYPLLLKIKSEQVVLCAMFDLMFSQSDRHGQNVFLDETGGLQLIDNEDAHGAINSMFLPGTQKFEIYRKGYNAVCCANTPEGCPGRVLPAGPDVFFDYRCHAPGGKVGFNYPPGMLRLVEKLDGMSAEAIQKEYGMTVRAHAETLKTRAGDLRKLGFEGALDAALARQPKGEGDKYGFNFSYPIVEPCCNPTQCEMRMRDKGRLVQMYEEHKAAQAHAGAAR